MTKRINDEQLPAILGAAAQARVTCYTCHDGSPIPETQPLPGNPKGSMYDAGVVSPVATDAAIPADAPMIKRLPANPKGTRYDAGLDPLKPTK